jgi:macrolide-specific efflux system membrane fusion protein
MVSANQEVLMRIADLSRMTVQVPVSEEDVTRLQKGMTAYFTTPGYPGKRWSGKLRQIMLLPTDDSGRQGKKAYYTVLFDVANPSRELMSGMSADVYFVLARAEHVPTIPRSLVTKPGMDGTQTVKVVAGRWHPGEPQDQDRHSRWRTCPGAVRPQGRRAGAAAGQSAGAAAGTR